MKKPQTKKSCNPKPETRDENLDPRAREARPLPEASTLIRSDELLGHTPGPWSYDDTYGLIVAGSVEIAACHAGRGADAKANARLIAMAPELLEVCEAVQKWLGHSVDANTERIGHLVDNVIKKARGQQ